ncbi:PREDICTED: flavonoid 3'-monooxygenase-like [Tarenaya hassleriana]|uniref:flavonoid 3'-monooxygenase-like n=1 Tax=Tarenaya hassleriana TaxID=28532 RepID=UPI00053C0DBC|nr:PREDICTED: flavonoid 3'-monooxygenase-like [Tarenaya hassleriana]
MENLFPIPYGVVLAVVALVFSVIWYIKLKRPARSPLPPGPPGLPVVGNLPFLKPDLHVYFETLARKYGPVFKLRLGAKLVVVVTSPEVVSEILKTHDVAFSNHDVTATTLIAMYGGADIGWTPYGPKWRMLRKVCVNRLLSNSVLDSFYGLRRRESRQIVRYLASRARTGSPVKLGEQIFLTLFNVITQMLWGATVSGEEREKTATEFKELVSEIVGLIGRPNISDFFPGLSRFDLQGLARQMRGVFEQFDQMFDRIIDQRLKTDGQSKRDGEDFLQFLLKLKNEDGTTSLSMTHVKALLMDLVLGGTGTSSSTIEFAMAELITKPEMMKRVQQELDQVVGKDNIVEESHIPKLPYLLAVIKETLRFHPASPLSVPRQPSETIIVAGYTIPKGSTVFFNTWGIQRDPSLWEKPLEFSPERFLNKLYDFNGNDTGYLPFGFGRRICAGIPMAETMISYNLAMLLHSFDWKIPEGKRFEIEEEFGLVLKLKNPLVAIPIPRLPNPNLYL